MLCDVPEEEVYNLSVSEANDLISKIQWLSSFEFSHKFKGGTIKIEDQEYTVDVDLQHMTIAQYGEGYDASKLAESLRENISIVKANEILFFSQRLSAFNKGFSNLFGLPDEEDDEEREGSTEEGQDRSSDGKDRGDEPTAYSWLCLIKKYSDTTKLP